MLLLIPFHPPKNPMNEESKKRKFRNNIFPAFIITFLLYIYIFFRQKIILIVQKISFNL